MFGFFRGPEITLPEQGEATILEIGFIKGGNVQTLTGIDRRNTARFGITVAGSASKWELLSISHHVDRGSFSTNHKLLSQTHHQMLRFPLRADINRGYRQKQRNK